MKCKRYLELKNGLVLLANPRNFPEAKRLTPAEGKRKKKEAGLRHIRAVTSEDPVPRLCFVPVSRSASGMSRRYRVYSHHENAMHNLTNSIADVLGLRSDGGNWLEIRGTGFGAADFIAEGLTQALGLTAGVRTEIL